MRKRTFFGKEFRARSVSDADCKHWYGILVWKSVFEYYHQKSRLRRILYFAPTQTIVTTVILHAAI